MTISADLARYVADTNPDSIPAEVLDNCKAYLLDALGAGISGVSSDVSTKLVRRLSSWGGIPESRIWGTSHRVPAPAAALANASMVHGMDLDAVQDDVTMHAYTSSVPAALAVSDSVKGSGAQALVAIALGADVAVRLASALGMYRGFILTAICGGFGAATSAAKTFGLDATGVLNTWGIEYGQTSGNRQTFLDAGSSTRLQPGFAASSGVLSAFLSRDGLDGAKEVFEGKAGFLNLYCESGAANFDDLTSDLGRRFRGNEVSIKPYPSCRGTHGPLDATIDILAKNTIDYRDVQEIVVRTPKNASGIFQNIGRPFELKPDPHVDAQYSIPYAVAAAVVRGDFFLDELRDEVIATPEILELSRKVRVQEEYPPALPKSLVPVEVDIRTRNAEYHSRVEVMGGNPANRVSFADVARKFERCVDFSGLTELKARCADIIALVADFDKCADTAELTAMLAVTE